MNIHLVITAAAVFSAFSYQPDGGAGLFPFSTAASESEPLVNTANAAYLPYQKSFFIRSSYENSYSIKGLAAEECSAGYGNGTYGFSGALSRFGINEYSEDRFLISAGKKVFPNMSIGIRGHADRVTFKTELVSSSYTLYDADLSAVWRPLPFFCLGYFQENGGSIFQPNKRDLLFPVTTLGVSVSASKGISLSWNVSRTAYGCVTALSCSAYIIPQLMIGGGYSRETERYAFQSALLIKGIRINYCFSYHPSLGVTHHAGVAWSPSSEGYDSADGNRPLYLLSPNKNRTIDISKCSASELADSAAISGEMAERLIRYRTLYGHITERSLYQMGLSAQERTSVMDHASGIITESEELEEERQAKLKNKGFRKEEYKQKKKDLFLLLVDGGLAPNAALKAALLIKGASGDYAAVIGRSNEFTPQEKKRIIEVCAGQ